MSLRREEGRKSLGDSSDDQSEGGSSTSGGRQSVICYTERGISLPSKFSLSSEESDSSPVRHLSSDDPDGDGEGTRSRSVSIEEAEAHPLSADEKLLRFLEADPKIAARFTDEDPEYEQEAIVSTIPPPVVHNWCGGGGGRGRGGFRGGNFGGRRRHEDQEGDNDRPDFKRPRHSDGYQNNRGGGGYNNQQQHSYNNRHSSDGGGSRDGRW